MDSNTDQTNPASDNGQSIDVKKLDDNPAPTQIVINSEDGSIMNAADVDAPAAQTEASTSEPVPSSETAQPAELASEETTQQIEVQETVADPVPSEEPPEAEVPVEAEELVQPTEEPVVAEVAPMTEELPEEPKSEEPQTEAATLPPAEEQAPQPVQEQVPQPQQEITEATPTQADNPMAIPPQPQKKAGAPKAAVIIAVLIAVALTAVVVFAYIKSQDKPHETGHTDTTENTQPVIQPVTSNDVDTATKEIDAEINKTTGDSDIPAADSVDDQALGL